MENDVLKNKIAPWQEKGRWYHAKLTSDETAWSLTNYVDTLNKQIVGSVYFAPFIDNSYEIIDVKVKISGEIKAQFSIPNNAFDVVEDPVRCLILLPPAARINGDVDIWLFAVEK